MSNFVWATQWGSNPLAIANQTITQLQGDFMVLNVLDANNFRYFKRNNKTLKIIVNQY